MNENYLPGSNLGKVENGGSTLYLLDNWINLPANETIQGFTEVVKTDSNEVKYREITATVVSGGGHSETWTFQNQLEIVPETDEKYYVLIVTYQSVAKGKGQGSYGGATAR